METNFTGGATRLWLYAGDPDASVHNEFESYAELCDLFMNTNNKNLFICQQGGTEDDQIWRQLAYEPE